MYKKKKFLAIIPARGGSKGLRRKNILDFSGKPLLVHSFIEAKKSKYLDRIVVSTEDSEIKAVAQSAGIEVIDRPAELALDHCSTESALIQVVKYFKEKENQDFDYVVTLQVTSPLRSAKSIDRGIELILSDNFDSLVSCSPIYKTLGTKEGNEFRPLIPFSQLPKRRQDRKPYYGSDGILWITLTASLLKEELCTAGKIALLETNDDEGLIDIDNLLGFKQAEFINKFNNEKK